MPNPESISVAFERDDVEQSIVSRFEGQVGLHPHRAAVRLRGETWTYRELNEAANRVAHAILAQRGLRCEPVGLVLSDDVARIAAMLGILKAGRFYVILDPEHPPARIASILEDAGSPLLVVDGEGLARVPPRSGDGVSLLNVEEIDPGRPAQDPKLHLEPDTLAYLIYTSGSTGRPKGVPQSHRNQLHQAWKHTQLLEITSADRLTLLSARTTGQAAAGLYCALLNGASLHPFDLRREGFARLAGWLSREEITIYHSSASVFRRFAQTLRGKEAFPALRVVKIGSEPVYQQDVALYRKHFAPTCCFVNALSCSETGLMRQYRIDHRTRVEGNPVPVGYAVPETEILLLDETGAPLGVGETGEIAVRSDSITPGYWKRPDLTREAFLDLEGGSRVFRTGDLGRMTPDGCLVHLGRKDLRVKVRGHRVELSEVEAALLEAEAVQEAVVALRGEPPEVERLVAYVVARCGRDPSVASLRAFLAERLPGFMVPTVFVFLDALPRTPHGKVDRRALPTHRSALAERDRPPVPPRNLLESELVTIWEELLGVEKVGVQDEFFELGGDSLLAVEMFTLIEEACGKALSPADLLEGLTVRELARALMHDRGSGSSPRMVTIQAGASDPPLFFFHGDFWAGGLYCRNLARHLGASVPFYALHPHGLGGEPVPRTVEAMAATYLEDVLAIRPDGSCVLGGFCTGGLVALELARELEARGVNVEALLLVDTRFRNAGFRSLRRRMRSLGSLLSFDEERETRWFVRLRDQLEGFHDSSMQGVSEQVRYLLRKARRVPGRLLGRKGTTRGPHRALWFAHHDAAERYVPEPYPGRIVLFCTRHVLDKPPHDPAAGWREVARDVRLHTLSSDHHGCLTRDVAELARSMRAYLHPPGNRRVPAGVSPPFRDAAPLAKRGSDL